MIRTEAGENVSKFVSEAFLDFMSHFCMIEHIDACKENGECSITYRDAELISDDFIEEIIGNSITMFDSVGGELFVKKKIVQLVAIAKAKDEVTLDLVSELILYMIGANCMNVCWEDGSGFLHYANEPFCFPQREELISSFMSDTDEEDRLEYNEKVKTTFTSFQTIMDLNRFDDGYVFFDLDYSFLLDHGVAPGILLLYFTVSDYSREWHERPWKDIGEEVPDGVVLALNSVEKAAEPYGGLMAMREKNMLDYQARISRSLAL